MSTLVTGGTGLVGSAHKKVFNNAKYVSSKDYDLRSLSDCANLFYDKSPTQVIHLAGKVGGLKANSMYLGDFYDDNILINTHVLKCAKDYRVEKVVSFLSTCIYPAEVTYPLTEEKLHEGDPHSSNFAYAYAKRMVEVQSRAYREQHGLNYVCVVPTNIYGPHDNYNLESSHVVPALIHKCYLAKRDDTDLVVWGSGKPLREFIYSEDIARLTEWALKEYDEALPIIFSNSVEISIAELVHEIAHALGFEGNIIFDSSKPDGQKKKPTDNSKLMSYLPNFEFTPFSEGIKKSVDWFVENYKDCRK